MEDTPGRMIDHWWWRPGVRPGRRVYVWHVLFDDRPAVRALVGDCRRRVAAIPWLEAVPEPWLHMTTQVVGFADEIGDDEVHDMLGEARTRLRPVGPVDVEFGVPLFHDEGLALGTRPRDGLDAMREGIRRSVAATVRAHRLADRSAWTPHVSVAYCNADAPAEPVVTAMLRPPAPVALRIAAVHLVSQERIGHAYVWDRVAAVELGPHGWTGPASRPVLS